MNDARCPECRAARAFDLAYEARVNRRRSLIAAGIALASFFTIALMFDQRTYLVTYAAFALAKVAIVVAGGAAAILGAIAFGKQQASDSLELRGAKGDTPYRGGDRCAKHAVPSSS